MTDIERIEMSWAGWGDPARAAPLPEAIARMLSEGLGVTAPSPVPTSVSELALSEVRLAPAIRDELVAVVGGPHARGDHEQRARHALGRSTIDLLRLRTRQTTRGAGPGAVPRAHTTRSSRCSSSARAGAWPSFRSAAGRRSSAR